MTSRHTLTIFFLSNHDQNKGKRLKDVISNDKFTVIISLKDFFRIEKRKMVDSFILTD